jgi:hypothetical protein
MCAVNARRGALAGGLLVLVLLVVSSTRPAQPIIAAGSEITWAGGDGLGPVIRMVASTGQGIALRARTDEDQLVYEFDVRAGGDAGSIVLDFPESGVALGFDSELRIFHGARRLVHERPKASQPGGRAVDAQFAQRADGLIVFWLGPRDERRSTRIRVVTRE